MLECRWPWSRNAASRPRTQSATGRDVGAQRDRGHRQRAAALGRLAHHPLDVGADVGREVGLVDRQQVGAGDAGAALARDVVAGGDVDDEDLHVGQRGREDRGQVVAAALDEDDVQRPGRGLELLDGLEVGGDVVADRGVRAAAGLDRGDPVLRQHARGAQELGVLGRVDVVGHDAEPGLGAQRAAQRGDQCSSCRSRRGRRRRSGVRVQLAKSRSLCSRWMGAESSIATAAGDGQRAVVGRDRPRGQRQRRRQLGEPARRDRRIEREQLQRGGRDRRGVVVEREQRRVLLGHARRRGDDAERERPRQPRHRRRPRPSTPTAAAANPAAARRRAAPRSASARTIRARASACNAYTGAAPVYRCMQARGAPRRRSGRRPRRRGAGGRG